MPFFAIALSPIEQKKWGFEGAIKKDVFPFISTAKPGTDIIYDEENFESGEIAAGFLFDINEMEVPVYMFGLTAHTGFPESCLERYTQTLSGKGY